MHIVIDTRIIETSTGRYMQRLVENINDTLMSREHHYTVLVPGPVVEKWQKRLPNLQVIAANQKWYTMREQWSLFWQLRGLKPDLVHFTMPQQPLLWRGPAITTIHDMTLIRYENISEDDNPTIYRIKQRVFLFLIRTVMRRAKAVIVPTEFVRNDLADFFGRQYIDRIYVTHEAGEIPDETPQPVSSLKNKKFLFFIGNAFPYKNVWKLVEAFVELKKTHPTLHLALAGKKDTFYRDIEQRIKEAGIPDVHILGFVSDGEKRWLFQNSQCFVTASLSEGFCVPLLEAMIEGTPVVAADASCLPEVVGNAGVLFDPSSTSTLVGAILPLLNSEKNRRQLVLRGKKRAASFSWQRMAKQTHDLYLRETLKP